MVAKEATLYDILVSKYHARLRTECSIQALITLTVTLSTQDTTVVLLHHIAPQ